MKQPDVFLCKNCPLLFRGSLEFLLFYFRLGEYKFYNIHKKFNSKLTKNTKPHRSGDLCKYSFMGLLPTLTEIV